MKKLMYPIFFRNTRLVKVINIDIQKIVRTNWYTTQYHTDILQVVNVSKLALHRDNALNNFSITRITAEF